MISTGEKIYSTEKSGYLREIDALRLKASKVEVLEAENRELNAELENAKQWHQRRSDSDGARGCDEANRSSATFEADAKTGNLKVDIEEFNRVKEELAKLESDYGRLAWARDHLEAKVREKKDSLREWKEYRKNWILKHPNKRLSHLRPSSTRASSVIDAENRRSSSVPAPPALPDGLTPGPSGGSRSPSPHHNAPPNLKNIECPRDQTYIHHTRDQTPQLNETGTSRAAPITAHADSGNVTEGTPESKEHAEPVKSEPATDGSSPIVVFERSLKRRHSARASDQNVHIHEDDKRHLDAASKTALPKDEQSSSPIHFSPRIYLDGRNDSLDLDDVGGHLDTPRKRQRMAQELLRSSMMEPLTAVQGKEDTAFLIIGGVSPQRFGEQHHELEGERDEDARSCTEKDKSLRQKKTEEARKASGNRRMARQHAHNNRVYQRLEAAEKSDPIFDLPKSSSPTTDESVLNPQSPNDPPEDRQGKPYLVGPAVLQPRDINASVLPRTSDPFASRKRPCPPSRRDRGAAYVPALAEDGEGLRSKSDALKIDKKFKDDQINLQSHSNREPKAPPTYHRLGALLTKPSPEKSILVPEEPVAATTSNEARSKTPFPQSEYHSRSKGPATPRSLPAKKSEPKRGSGIKADPEPIDATLDRHSKSAQAVTKRTKDVPTFAQPSPISHPETRPEHEPLRARPLHRLGLQDFKFNPIHGDYAYHESVRRHDEKKSLSGCTDRNCHRCKGLRKYVLDSCYKTAQKPGESQDEADDRLLHDFLGGEDNPRNLSSSKKKTTTTMSPTQRSHILLEAKVKEFADRFGCHRQAFSRAREPPGFWEVDFPSTQQEADDRALADVWEREKVQERYWEACRPGGKWMFADE